MFRSVEGAWSQWTSSSCSKTCGVGTFQRTRACDSPAPLHEGRPCDGESSETLDCYLKPCPSKL